MNSLKDQLRTHTNLNLNAVLSQFSTFFLKATMCRKVYIFCPSCGQLTDIDDWLCFRAYARGLSCLIEDLPVREADIEPCEDCETDMLEHLDMVMFGPREDQTGQPPPDL